MNEYDSDKMADVLRAAEGYEPTQDVEQADLVLFNTCSVREKAQEKSFTISARQALKRACPACDRRRRCVASQEVRRSGARRRTSISCSVRRPCTVLPEMIDARVEAAKRRSTFVSPRWRISITFRRRACDCVTRSFRSWRGAAILHVCVVPYTRGEESPSFDSVLTEFAEVRRRA